MRQSDGAPRSPGTASLLFALRSGRGWLAVRCVRGLGCVRALASLSLPVSCWVGGELLTPVRGALKLARDLLRVRERRGREAITSYCSYYLPGAKGTL